MKHAPAYQWYPGDALASSRIQRMSLEEEGAYRRLLDFQWMDGFIPADIGELSRMCKVSPRKMASIWDRLRSMECFVPTAADPDKLVNPRIEQIRRDQFEHRETQVEAGRRGAAKRWGDHGDPNGVPTVSPIAKNSSSLSIGEEKNSKEQNSSPVPVKAAHPPDPAFETFRAIHDAAFEPAKYKSTKADFVSLAELRKVQGVGARASPPGWEPACRNYVASPQGSYSLKDLCSRYNVFVMSALDRYGKPNIHVEAARKAVY